MYTNIQKSKTNGNTPVQSVSNMPTSAADKVQVQFLHGKSREIIAISPNDCGYIGFLKDGGEYSYMSCKATSTTGMLKLYKIESGKIYFISYQYDKYGNYLDKHATYDLLSTISPEDIIRVFWQGYSSSYISVNNALYRQEKAIIGAHADSFRLVGLGEFDDPRIDPLLWKMKYSLDDKDVYFQDKIISGADPASFTFIGRHLSADQEYAKDKNSVYYLDRKIEKADPTTYQLLGVHNIYAKDAAHIFYKDAIVDGADVSSFDGELLLTTGNSISPLYAVDKDHVYYDGRMIVGANPKTYGFPAIKSVSNNY